MTRRVKSLEIDPMLSFVSGRLGTWKESSAIPYACRKRGLPFLASRTTPENSSAATRSLTCASRAATSSASDSRLAVAAVASWAARHRPATNRPPTAAAVNHPVILLIARSSSRSAGKSAGPLLEG